jgi:glycosyltransferase involved in cell wall biosynthesis
MDYPLVSIAVISFNRLHYLKATLESAKECIQYPNIEWIVSDNSSKEPGLREYLEGLDWVQVKIFGDQSHADAMNEIVAVAKGEYLFIWPEDVQFVVKGDWLIDVIDILNKNRDIGSIGLNFLRRKTYKSLLTYRKWFQFKLIAAELYYFKFKFRFSRNIVSSRGFKAFTLGFVWPGICGSGIPSVARTQVWKDIGPWKSTKTATTANIIDSSLGSEEDMVKRFYKKGIPLQQACLFISVAADIINDSMGAKAKVRKGFRYGNYTAPANGHFYYELINQDKIDSKVEQPIAFEDIITPISFTLPLDENGNMLKAAINMSVKTQLP